MVTASVVVNATPQVVGLLPEGVANDIAGEIARRVRAKVEKITSGFTVRSVRMVPSTTTRLDADTIQFIANATLVPISNGDKKLSSRAKVVDSVVTLDLGGTRVREIAVPFLERRDG